MKKALSILIIFTLLYYIGSFITSFLFISNYIIKNNDISLNYFLNNDNLRKNYEIDISNFGNNFSKISNKKIKIQSSSTKFTGELTPAFFKKLFKKLSMNISRDFSQSNVMLYFYFNSDQLQKYIDKAISNFGEYNFQKYLKDLESEKIEEPKEDTKEKEEVKEEEEKVEEKIIEKDEKKENEFKKLIFKLISKYKHTKYFFLTSPIHFKLEVEHQNLPFTVIFKFNGIKWKVNDIVIPYDQLININLTD